MWFDCVWDELVVVYVDFGDVGCVFEGCCDFVGVVEFLVEGDVVWCFFVYDGVVGVGDGFFWVVYGG